MAASLIAEALLLLPWLHARSARIDGSLDLDSDLDSDLGLNRTPMRRVRHARGSSALDLSSFLGLNDTFWRHARRARGGSALDLNSALDLRCNERWTKGRKVGEGSFGEIFTVTSGSTPGILKKLKLPADVAEGDEDWVYAVDEFEKEKKVMKVLEDAQCPNTVRLRDANPCDDRGQSAPFQFVMVLYQTDLRKYMHSYKDIKNKDGTYGKCFKTIFREVVKGVDCMNKAGWVHMDIKEGNVFISHPQDTGGLARFDCKDVKVAVGDFGLAYPENLPQRTFQGSPAYHPPETFGKGHGLGLKWHDAGHFVTDRKIDWCMLRILAQRLDDKSGSRMFTEAFLNEIPNIVAQPWEECKYRG